jgi:hypothetical protein
MYTNWRRARPHVSDDSVMRDAMTEMHDLRISILRLGMSRMSLFHVVWRFNYKACSTKAIFAQAHHLGVFSIVCWEEGQSATSMCGLATAQCSHHQEQVSTSTLWHPIWSTSWSPSVPQNWSPLPLSPNQDSCRSYTQDDLHEEIWSLWVSCHVL